MTKSEMKSYNVLLTEQQQRSLPYHQVRYINMSICQARKYSPQKNKIIEEVKFTYSPLWKGLQKQKTQAQTLKSLEPPSKKIP